MTAPALITEQETLPKKKFGLAIFASEKHSTPERQVYLTLHQAYNLLNTRDERDTKSGWAFVPGTVEGTRANDNVKSLDFLVADSDGGVPVRGVIARLKGHAGMVYTTHSHSEGHAKCRAVLPLAESVRREDWPAFWEGVREYLGEDIMDLQCKDPARIYFGPSCPKGTAHLHHTETLEGALLAPAPRIARGREILNARVKPPVMRVVDNRFPQTPENKVRMESATAALNPKNQERNEWRDSLYAIASLEHTEGWDHETVRALAHGLSSRDPERYFPDEVDNILAKYDPARPDRIRIGTYFQKATAAGWEDPVKASDPAWLIDMNKRYAFIEADNSVYDIQHKRLRHSKDIHDRWANKLVDTGTPEKPKMVSASKAWLAHSKRRQHKRLVLAPDQPEVTADNELNIWQGFAVPAIQGDVTPWLELIGRVIPDAGDRERVTKRMAYKIKKPAAKFNTSLVLWSHMQGTGKNLLAESFGRIFNGAHWCVIGQDELMSPFNGWQSGQVCVIADEVSGVGDRRKSDRLKVMQTATTNTINIKFAPQITEPNLIAYIFLSNHPDAMYMGEEDRRNDVIQASNIRLPEELAERFVRWRDSGGLSALRYYLENYDTSGFDPLAPAPMTRAKAEMIEDNRSDLERWLHGILTAESISSLLGREICTAEELASKYKNASGTSISSRTVSNALLRAGVRRSTKRAYCKGGKRPRVYALCNYEDWEVKTEGELGAVMDKKFNHYGE